MNHELQSIGGGVLLDINALAFVSFREDGDPLSAYLRFKSGASEELTGDPAQQLSHLLRNKPPQTAEDPTKPSAPTASHSGSFDVDTLALSLPRKKKAWYFNSEQGQFYAFVDAKGACTIRTFKAEDGRFGNKEGDHGSYAVRFQQLLRVSQELPGPRFQPNLERDCNPYLPAQVLEELRQQAGLAARSEL